MSAHRCRVVEPRVLQGKAVAAPAVAGAKKPDQAASSFAGLRAKSLLAQNAPPCLELKVQLLGAEFCAVLSQTLACQADLRCRKTKERQTVSQKTSHAGSEATKEKSCAKVAQQKLQEARTRHWVANRCAGTALTAPVLRDLSTHYGAHAMRRGMAKPLGPSFRSRQNCETGAHEGRAWQIWRKRLLSRTWCRRCGAYLQVRGATAFVEVAEQDATATAVADNLAACHRSGRSRKKDAKKVRTPHKVASLAAGPVPVKKRVCLRCFNASMKRCIRYERRQEARTRTKNENRKRLVASEIKEGHIPNLAKLAKGWRPMPTFDPLLLKYSVIAAAQGAAVKRTCRRKRRLSKVKQEKVKRAQAKKKAAVVAGATTIEAQRRVVKQVLLKAVPKGPIARARPLPTKAVVVPAPPTPLPMPTGATSKSTPLATPLSVMEKPAMKTTAVTATPTVVPPLPKRETAALQLSVSTEKPKPVGESRLATGPSTSSPPATPSPQIDVTKVVTRSAPARVTPVEEKLKSTAVASAAPTTAVAAPPPPLRKPLPKTATALSVKRPPPGPLSKKSASTPAKSAATAGKKKVMDVMNQLGF